MLPIYFINLASRPDRREHVEGQLDRLGLTGIRIEAVSSQDIKPASETTLGAGELGCGHSHQLVWRMLVEQGIPAALILEDDVLLSSSVPSLLRDPAMMDLKPDAIRLETRRSNVLIGRGTPTTTAGVTLARLMSSSLGAAAYIMTDKLARQLLARPDLDEQPVDQLLFGWPGSLFYDSRIFQTLPALAIQIDETVDGRLGAGRSDLTQYRQAASMGRRYHGHRLRRLASYARHYVKVVQTFGASGELCGARHLQLPVAKDLHQLMP